MSLFPSLIEAVRRNRVRTNTGPLNFTPAQFARLASLQHYDLGGMFQRGHADDIGLDELSRYHQQIEAEIARDVYPDDVDDISIEFLWTVKGRTITHLVPTPGRAAMEAAAQGQWVTCFAFYAGGWHVENIDAEVTCMVAKRVIEDAELNVEFIERPDDETEQVNRGRAMGGLSPIKTTRVISLSYIRKQYLGGSRSPHNGGSHRSPCGHFRDLTERVISPKGRKSYVQRARRIAVKGGPSGTITKVTM